MKILQMVYSLIAIGRQRDVFFLHGVFVFRLVKDF
jgi:hypothetical protein